MPERLLLENADDNTCFGCGPENPMGLRLKFYKEGERVTTEATPTRWWSGQPGVVNPGILYAVLFDLCIWTGDAILHRVILPGKTPVLELGGVSVHKPFRGAGWLVKREGQKLLLRAEIEQDGKTRGVMEMEGELVTREAYQRARPLVELPPSLQGYFEGE